jgi:hypothetical protein
MSRVTGYRPKELSSIPVKNRDFSLARDVETGSEALTGFPCSGNRRKKWPESKADHFDLAPSLNMPRAIFPLPTKTFMA